MEDSESMMDAQNLVAEYGGRLHRFIGHMAGWSEAEDLLQETFLRVVRSAGRYREEGKLQSWLFRIADNVCRDHLRASRLRRSMALDESAVDLRSGPLESLAAREEREAVAAAVRSLTEEQRRIFLLREEGGMTFREIAEMSGESINTVLGRMHDALRKMKSILNPTGGK